MILLRSGDSLPAVAGTQLPLNAHRAPGSQIRVDGAFGPVTRDAVMAFQRMFPGHSIDGHIGSETWRRLSAATNLSVRDWADVSDPVIEQMVEVVRAQGSTPLIQGPSSLAVGNVAPAISASGVRRGELFLLRFLDRYGDVALRPQQRQPAPSGGTGRSGAASAAVRAVWQRRVPRLPGGRGRGR